MICIYMPVINRRNKILEFNEVRGSKIWAVAICLILIASPIHAANQSMMELLRILRDKGTLTQNEYELLVNASKADKERAGE